MTHDLLILCPTEQGAVADHAARIADFGSREGVDVVSWTGKGDRPDARAVLVEYDGADPRWTLNAQSAAVEQLEGEVSLFVHRPWPHSAKRPVRILSSARRRLDRYRRIARNCIAPVKIWTEWLSAEFLPIGPTALGPGQTPSTAHFPWLVPMSYSADLMWEWIEGTIPPEEIRVADDGSSHESLADESFARLSNTLTRTNIVGHFREACAILLPLRNGATAGHVDLFNATLAGIPVITTRGPLFDPAFEASPLRLCDSHGDFIEELLWVQQEPRLSDSSRAWVLDRYDPDALDRRLLELTLA